MWLSEGFKSDNKTCSIHIITHFKNWSNYFLPLLKSEFLEPPEIFLYVRKMEVHTPLNIKNLSQSVKIERGWSNKIGGDLLSRGCAVPSARLGLTSLFGMGRGDPQRYNHQNIVWTTLRFYDLEAISFSFTFFSQLLLVVLTLSRHALLARADASFGQLVRLGFDIAVFTPASYQRHRLWRPS